MANEPFQPDSRVDDGSAAQPARPAEDPRYAGATPPGYDWPTHGGYLGCLLATMLACLLAPLSYIVIGFLGAFLSGPLGNAGIAIAIVVTVVGYLALFVGLMRLGWRMGRRFLREYPQPARPVWGEDENVIIVDANPPPREPGAASPEDTAGGENTPSTTH